MGSLSRPYGKRLLYRRTSGHDVPHQRLLSDPRPGQIQVDPGVIILGYKGDPLVDDPNSTVKRPEWATDGTMMVFRKLEQDVLSFDKYIKTHGKRWREFAPGGDANNLTDEEGAELFGARMMGRWKSVGSPDTLASRYTSRICRTGCPCPNLPSTGQ